MPNFPVLRVVSGVVFVLAGLVAYFRINIGVLGLIFIVAGGGIIALTLLGHKAQGGDVALFIISVLVLAVAGTNFVPIGTSQVNYSGQRSAISVNRIDVSASTSIGSVELLFSTNSSLGYEVSFIRTSFLGFFPFAGYNYTFNDRTSNGVLHLNASAAAADIRITIGVGYLTNIDLSSATGSVSLSAPYNQSFGAVSLSSNTGSVDANMVARNISSLSMNTNTGSVDLTTAYFSASGPRIPVRLSANTGSVSISMRIPASNALALNATTSLGSISHNLPGFTLTQSTNRLLLASTGNVETASNSFVVSASTDTGSVSVQIQKIS